MSMKKNSQWLNSNFGLARQIQLTYVRMKFPHAHVRIIVAFEKPRCRCRGRKFVATATEAQQTISAAKSTTICCTFGSLDDHDISVGHRFARQRCCRFCCNNKITAQDSDAAHVCRITSRCRGLPLMTEITMSAVRRLLCSCAGM